jgi:hypothetical protein
MNDTGERRGFLPKSLCCPEQPYNFDTKSNESDNDIGVFLNKKKWLSITHEFKIT